MGHEDEPDGLFIDARSAASVRRLAKTLQEAFHIRVHEDDVVVIATEFAYNVLASHERNEDLIDVIRRHGVEPAKRDEFDAAVERRSAQDDEVDDEFGPAAENG